MRELRRVAKGLALAFLALGGTALAQQMPVPVDVQVPVLLKVLSFDRRIADTRGQELVIGVLYQSGYRLSTEVKDRVVEVVSVSRQGAPASRPLSAAPVDADGEESLGAAFARLKIDVLYVTPLRAFDLRNLVGVTRRERILTLTGVPEYVGAGLSVGLELRQDRPRILVNLRAARAEGANFAAPLLGLARLVEERP